MIYQMCNMHGNDHVVLNVSRDMKIHGQVVLSLVCMSMIRTTIKFDVFFLLCVSKLVTMKPIEKF